MIRSGRIPPVLNRICDDQIPTALLVTYDGELLGSSSAPPNNNNALFPFAHKDPEAFGTLLADIAMEYSRLGEEYNHGSTHNSSSSTTTTANRKAPSSSSSKMDCLLLQMEGGLAAAVPCPTMDCFVLAVAKTDTPPGLLRARLHALADHIQESMSLLMENAPH